MYDNLTYLCLDTETTGLEQPIGVVEVAWIEVILEEGDYTLTRPFSTLVKSPYPISCGAGGLNGLRDEDLVDSPTLAEIAWPQGPVCLVSHNVVFDRPLVEPYLDIREELCTMVLARRLIPGIENYKLSTLAAALELSSGLSHRAQLDVINVGELLIFMLQGAKWSVEKMLDFYKKPYVARTMGFGKHAGIPMEEVPLPYLVWLSKQDLDRDTRATVDYYLRKGR